MKKLDTHYSTISFDNDNYGQMEKRIFLTDEAARKDAINDFSNACFMLYKNDEYVNENDKIFTNSIFMGRIVSGSEHKTHYLQLCGVDKNNDEHPICAFALFKTIKMSLPEIDKEYNYEHYNVYLITEHLVDKDVVQEYEYFATLPSRKSRVTNYYAISAINEFDFEKQIASFMTLEELEKYTIIPKEDYIKYNYYEALLIFSEDELIEKRMPINAINYKKVRKLSK